jgi:hypothetical protein
MVAFEISRSTVYRLKINSISLKQTWRVATIMSSSRLNYTTGNFRYIYNFHIFPQNIFLTSMARLTFSLLLAPAAAHISQGRTQHGLIGYGIQMYDPGCAFACRDTVTSWMLDCGDAGTNIGSHHGGMAMATPTPLCYATNDPFLQTLALCIANHCKEEPLSKLEYWWETYLVGRQPGQPYPKISYQTALENIQTQPMTIVGDEDVLNATSLVDEAVWLANYNGDHGYDITEARSSTYGCVLQTS